MRRAARRLIPHRGLRRRLGTQLVAGVKRLYTRRQQRAALPPGLRQRLSHELEGEVRRLGDLVGRDLRGWLEPSLPAPPPSTPVEATL